MKRIIAGTIAGAATLALAAPAVAQTREDIMNRVVWPCVADAVDVLALQEHQQEAAETIMFELHRDYYEEIVDAVEESLRENPDDDAAWSIEAGLAICIRHNPVMTVGRF